MTEEKDTLERDNNELKSELQKLKRNYDQLEHLSKDRDEVILTDGPV